MDARTEFDNYCNQLFVDEYKNIAPTPKIAIFILNAMKELNKTSCSSHDIQDYIKKHFIKERRIQELIDTKNNVNILKNKIATSKSYLVAISILKQKKGTYGLEDNIKITALEKKIEEIINKAKKIGNAKNKQLNEDSEYKDQQIINDINDEDILPSRNIIFYGPPGTGKTHKINQIKRSENLNGEENKVKDENFVFVTFHQTYSYEDFIEGIRPVLQTEKRKDTSDEIKYEIKSGIFKDLCEKARKSQDTNERFVIFIDEINRGNISKIFGELITLIEENKRMPVDYDWNKKHQNSQEDNPNWPPQDDATDDYTPIKVILPYSRKAFSVPANVEIYGAMNTADRSLTQIDTALRRRFKFEPVWPEPGLLTKELPVFPKGVKNNTDGPLTINLQDMLETINSRIEALLDHDHTIGHAFFWDFGYKDIKHSNDPDGDAIQNFEKLKNVFRYKIIPLLEEYFFEDWARIQIVLGDNDKDDKYKFIKSNQCKSLFRGNIDISILNSLKKAYCINEDAFDSIESYIGIYKKLDNINQENQNNE